MFFVLPLVQNTCNTLLYTKYLPWRISNLKKPTQALSVYRKGTFCEYIKCLIVISWKVMIKRDVREKVILWHTDLSEQWNLGMPPTRRLPPCPRNQDMLKYSWLQMISMLQSMQCDSGLWRGSITIISNRFDMAHSTG